MLTFDPAEHSYQLEGRRLPNVTGVLEPLVDYSKVPPGILQAAKERGNYVHRACEMLLWGTLDEEELDPQYAPYIDAFKWFLADTEFRPEYIEDRVYHKTLKYAGTLDLAGILPPMGRRKKDKFVLIDLKTTFTLMASVGPQTAAYAEAWASHKPKAEHFEERYGLRLTKEGKYELRPMKGINDFNVFRACLVLYNFMQKEKPHG